MEIILPALAVAFAALCIWLGARIVNRRERWAKWTLAGTIIVVPIRYVLGLGPICWLYHSDWDLEDDTVALMQRSIPRSCGLMKRGRSQYATGSTGTPISGTED